MLERKGNGRGRRERREKGKLLILKTLSLIVSRCILPTQGKRKDPAFFVFVHC